MEEGLWLYQILKRMMILKSHCYIIYLGLKLLISIQKLSGIKMIFKQQCCRAMLPNLFTS